MSADLTDDESNVLLNDGIQAVKPSKNKPLKKNVNINYTKVAEIIKNNSPIEEEVVDEAEISRLEQAIAEMSQKKPRKKRADAGITKDMSKAQDARKKKLAETQLLKAQLQAEYDKQQQAVIIKKAVAIKKKQLKQTKQVEAVNENVLPEVKKPVAPLAPKYIFV